MRTADLLAIYARMGKTPPADLAPAAHKYNARSKILDGITFASSGEARLYQVLKLRENAGIISNLELQPWFTLLDKFTDADGVKHRAIRYRADFSYVDSGGAAVVADYKGMLLPAFRDKAKLFRARYPSLRLEIWTRETFKSLA